MKLRTILISSAIAAIGASAWAQGTATDPMAAKPAAAAATGMTKPATTPMSTATPASPTQDKAVGTHKVAKAKHHTTKTMRKDHKQKMAPAAHMPTLKDGKKVGTETTQ